MVQPAVPAVLRATFSSTPGNSGALARSTRRPLRTRASSCRSDSSSGPSCSAAKSARSPLAVAIGSRACQVLGNRLATATTSPSKSTAGSV